MKKWSVGDVEYKRKRWESGGKVIKKMGKRDWDKKEGVKKGWEREK